MQGAIHSINVSGSGGVPKVSVKATVVNFEGLEGDYNRFRTERKAGDPGRAVCIFSLERYDKSIFQFHLSSPENLKLIKNLRLNWLFKTRMVFWVRPFNLFVFI